jgi:carboxyl-terminal processing protease
MLAYFKSYNLIFRSMKRVLFYSISLLLLLSLNSACKKNPAPETTVPAETVATNKWIYDNMNMYYLWKSEMPTNIDYTKESDPEKYFYKLLYTQLDKWSYITNDYASLAAELNGNPVTMGYSPAFYLVGTKQVIIVVQYVYPGSAASDAGLKRGDIILSIDNASLDTTNYYNKYSGNSYSVQLGQVIGNSLSLTGQSLTMTARTTLTDPAIYHTTFDINGHKIGYLVYVEFITGSNNAYLTGMDTIFSAFKSKGITDLVVDLRYNPGGEIDAAIHLGSLIAPATATETSKIMVNLQYNTELQQYFTTNNYTQYLNYKFEPASDNLDMNHVYFLTTTHSASASELLITGLKPYMGVTQVGEHTYGKYCGSWVIPDSTETWAIMPMVTKFANADGFTDFVNGLTPDYTIQDDLVNAAQFGDVSDPMVAKALSLISGKSVAAKSLKVPFLAGLKQIRPPEMDVRRNLVLHHPAPVNVR